MTDSWLDRSKKLIGENNLLKLSKKTVVVLGLGGVGGSCAEALCRAGIGKLILIDNDEFEITNLNRQILATRDCLNLKKCEVAKKRFELINPKIKAVTGNFFCTSQNYKFIFDFEPDYIADCIDTITTKILLAVECYNKNFNLLSCLGMGNRLNPEEIKIGDINDTIGTSCRMSRIIRHKLKEKGIKKLDVVYSTEKPVNLNPIGSVSFVPPVAGYFMASKIIKVLLNKSEVI